MRAFSRSLFPWDTPGNLEEKDQKLNPSESAHSEGGTRRRRPDGSDVTDRLENAPAWLIFHVGGLIGDGGQARTKLEPIYPKAGRGAEPGEQELSVRPPGRRNLGAGSRGLQADAGHNQKALMWPEKQGGGWAPVLWH